ncbi:MAG: hypothetical protein AVDCRST_MAG07-2594 [uncultured Frankineae bacterium]|uniref:DUF1440 domain-containing protein n=1 Tax=uncultured Frankineae bacterium TaxID=437475 RepID=A0A6J4LXL6_9ACTN|nr:MAG: hypothetical protein AVDCRST_MAG07-2594 [uncultured Frankineae bacterium]
MIGTTPPVGGPRRRALLAAAGQGALLGIAGAAVMTAGEKAEQAVTGRPDSYVPGRTLMTLAGRRPPDRTQPPGWNLAMHYGTGAVFGALRGVWSVLGLQGPHAHVAATVVRLAFDQTVENATGIGAPPPTWPVREQVVDVLHKTVYTVVTGLLTDRTIAPVLQSRAGTTSH